MHLIFLIIFRPEKSLDFIFKKIFIFQTSRKSKKSHKQNQVYRMHVSKIIIHHSMLFISKLSSVTLDFNVINGLGMS